MKRPQKYKYLKGASALDIHANLLNYYRDLEYYVEHIEREIYDLKRALKKIEEK